MEDFESIHALFLLEDICDPTTVNDWCLEEADEEAPTQLLSPVELASLLTRAAILLDEEEAEIEPPVVQFEVVEQISEIEETDVLIDTGEPGPTADIAPPTDHRLAAIVAWLRGMGRLQREELLLMILSFATVSTLCLQVYTMT